MCPTIHVRNAWLWKDKLKKLSMVWIKKMLRNVWCGNVDAECLVRGCGLKKFVANIWCGCAEAYGGIYRCSGCGTKKLCGGMYGTWLAGIKKICCGIHMADTGAWLWKEKILWRNAWVRGWQE